MSRRYGTGDTPDPMVIAPSPITGSTGTLATSIRPRSTRVPGMSPGARYLYNINIAREEDMMIKAEKTTAVKANRLTTAQKMRNDKKTKELYNKLTGGISSSASLDLILKAFSKEFTRGNGEINASQLSKNSVIYNAYSSIARIEVWSTTKNKLITPYKVRSVDGQRTPSWHCEEAQKQLNAHPYSKYTLDFDKGNNNNTDVFNRSVQPIDSVRSIDAFAKMTNIGHKQILDNSYGVLKNDNALLPLFRDYGSNSTISVIHPAGKKAGKKVGTFYQEPKKSNTTLQFVEQDLKAVIAGSCTICDIPLIGFQGKVSAMQADTNLDYDLHSTWNDDKYKFGAKLVLVSADTQASYCDHWAAMIIGSLLGVFIEFDTLLHALIFVALCKTCNTKKGNMVTIKLVIKLINGKYRVQLEFDDTAAWALVDTILPLSGIITPRLDEGNPARRHMDEMVNSLTLTKRNELRKQMFDRIKEVSDRVVDEANKQFDIVNVPLGRATLANIITACIDDIKARLEENPVFEGGTKLYKGKGGGKEEEEDDMVGINPGLDRLHGILTGSKDYKDEITAKINSDFKELTQKQREEIIADATNTTSARKIIMDINLYLTMINYNQELDEEWIISMISPMQTALESSDHSNINEYTIHFFNNLLKLYNANPEHYPGEKLRVCINTIDQLQKQSSETNKAQSATSTTVFTPITQQLSQKQKEGPRDVLINTLTKLTKIKNDLDNGVNLTDIYEYANIKVSESEPVFTIGGVITYIDSIEKKQIIMEEDDMKLINSIKELNKENMDKIQKKLEDNYYEKGTVFNTQPVTATAGGKPKKVGTKKKRDKQSKRISHGKKNKTETSKNRKTKKTGTRKNKKSKK